MPILVQYRKNIVYNDTVLPLKEKGRNLKITTVEDVKEASLDDCLTVLFDSNHDVEVNTIQYSRANKKLYIYANKYINTRKWEEQKYVTYKAIENPHEIVREIKAVLNYSGNNEKELVSLEEVYKVLSKKYKEYSTIVRDVPGDLICYELDYDKNELKMGYEFVDGYDHIVFSKKDGDLYVKKSETAFDDQIMSEYGDMVSKLYDKLLEFKDSQTQHVYNIKPINANFLVSLFNCSILVENGLKFTINHFFDDSYVYDCNSQVILSSIRNKEKKFFRNIYIKISDCPEWSREILRENKKNKLKYGFWHKLKNLKFW